MSRERHVTSFRTIAAVGEGYYTEKRSKFISLAIPVSTEEEAQVHIARCRREYYDARHVCWAYRIGTREIVERVNDDGEPSSTAGKPILGQLLSRDLTQCMVVVVRYFGGVKLGTGGLIVAYRSAAESALEACEMVEVELLGEYSLHFPFDLINPVMMLLREVEAEVVSTDADLEGNVYKIRVPERNVDSFEHSASALYRLRIRREDE